MKIKETLKKYTPALLAGGILIGGIVSANIADLPTVTNSYQQLPTET